MSVMETSQTKERGKRTRI